MTDALDEKVGAIIKQVAELPESFEITGDQNLKSDLEIDSLMLIDLVARMEVEFGIEVDDESSGGLVTVAELQSYVRGLVTNPIS